MKSTSERQTEKLGRRLAKTFSGGETVLLVGELGAGKTRFVIPVKNKKRITPS